MYCVVCIILKIISAIFLLSTIWNLVIGPGVNQFGSAGAGIVLNAVWFAIINFRPPSWIGFVLWLLIFTGLACCHKIVRAIMEEGEIYK